MHIYSDRKGGVTGSSKNMLTMFSWDNDDTSVSSGALRLLGRPCEVRGGAGREACGADSTGAAGPRAPAG